MSNSIALNKIELDGQKVIYNFSIPSEIREHINPVYIDSQNNGTLFVELPNDVDAKEIPEGVLTIPFVGTMIGVAMLYRTPIKVPDVDKEYFETVKKLDIVFRKMYPKGNLSLVLEASRVSTAKNNRGGIRTSVFFTGGVDATSALVETVNKAPLLINIAGGDIALSDQTAHERLEDYFSDLKKQIKGLDYCFVRSNCREFFREYTFDKMCKKFIDRELWWGYWASFAHIVVMTASIAPVIYARGITQHYIGSSHSSNDVAFDGNNEELINAIGYAGCKFISADADLDRNDKVKKVVEYSNTSGVHFKLQVCWHKENGLNCCHCEKCYRTIMNVLSAHGDPNNFGLTYNTDKMAEIKRFLETTPVKVSYWKTTQNVFQKEHNYWDKTELAWFVNFKFNQPKTYLYKVIGVVKRKMRKK